MAKQIDRGFNRAFENIGYTVHKDGHVEVRKLTPEQVRVEKAKKPLNKSVYQVNAEKKKHEWSPVRAVCLACGRTRQEINDLYGGLLSVDECYGSEYRLEK